MSEGSEGGDAGEDYRKVLFKAGLEFSWVVGVEKRERRYGGWGLPGHYLDEGKLV